MYVCLCVCVCARAHTHQQVAEVGAGLARKLAGQDVDAHHDNPVTVQAVFDTPLDGIVEVERLLDGCALVQKLDAASHIAGDVGDESELAVVL